jgi:uncharacterized membrane protein YecN with MAPEG domain
MNGLPITLATASTLGIMLIWLSARVIASRVKNQALIGDQGNQDLLFAIRTQGNFSEYTPLFLILLGLLEFSQVLAGLFIVSRLLHMLGMGEGANLRLRQLGMIGTFTAIIVASVLGLYSVLS